MLMPLRIQLLIFTFTTLIYARKTYLEVGCFADDEGERAISGGHVTYARGLVIDECHKKAIKAGNSYFAVQNRVDCFTSSDAGSTYNKYGRSTGCRNGVGAFLEMTVYWNPPGAAVIQDSLKVLDDRLASEWKGGLKTCAHSGTCNRKYDSVGGIVLKAGKFMREGAIFTSALEKAFKDGKFKKVAAKVAKFSAALSGIGSLVSIVDIFTFANSQDIKLDLIIDILTNGFYRIEERFDDLENKIEDLEDAMKYQHFKTSIRPALKDLNFVNNLVEDYFDGVSDERKQALVNQYDNIYEAIVDLYSEFTGDYDGTPLCDRVTDHKKVHRRDVMRTLIQLFSRFTRGVSNFLLIVKLKGSTDFSYLVNKVDGWLSEISDGIEECDSNIESKEWLDQWVEDYKRVRSGTPKRQALQLASRIYNSLTRKYYWRDWLVLVYDNLSGDKHHYVRACDEGSYSFKDLHWKKWYNIVVSSVSPTKEWNTFRGKKIKLKSRNYARTMFRRLPKAALSCNYPIVYVIRRYRKKRLIYVAKFYRSHIQTLCVGRRCKHRFELGILG